MVVRVDRAALDPVAVTSQAGGGRFYDDGTRDDPWQPRPFTTRNEYVVSEAMRLMSVPAEVIRNTRPPFISDPFPSQLGWGPRRPLTIDEVLDTDRWQPQIRSWISGTPRQPRHVDVAEDAWSGTLRGFNASPNIAG